MMGRFSIPVNRKDPISLIESAYANLKLLSDDFQNRKEDLHKSDYLLNMAMTEIREAQRLLDIAITEYGLQVMAEASENMLEKMEKEGYMPDFE